MRAATLFSQVIDFPAFSSINRGEPPGSGSETPFLPASAASVASVVKLRIAPFAVKSRENRG